MKILILGGSGMLGHRLWIQLQKHHDVWITVRGSASDFSDVPEFPREKIRTDVDARNFEQVSRALASIQPELVINCIGMIKQHGHVAKDPLIAITLNSLFPHRLSLLCKVANIRLIHISTDCVFSGKKGNYTEEDIADSDDIYGRTKYLGEVEYDHCVTLRTSIIGPEIKNGLGLVEWFLTQNETANGFTHAIFSGVTTDELSRIINDYVIPNPDLSGKYHVSAQPISKYELLKLLNVAFNKEVTINPYADIVIDRSLNSDRFRLATGYTPPTWEDMIEEMAGSINFYERINTRIPRLIYFANKFTPEG
ncbi:MAG: SDR family oxidoreductase [Anaerolineaceae bacterium]|nr:SDR family oxidoreductase [Anaerolineaceae bacterium]